MFRHLVLSQYFLYDNKNFCYTDTLEGISWTKEADFDVLWVYNKGAGRVEKYIHDSGGPTMISFQNKLKNVGREQHSYLKYIVDNYFSLPDVMIFSQANPFAHEPKFLEKINGLSNEHIVREGYIGLSGYDVFRPSYLSGISWTLKRVFGVSTPETIRINGNGLFAVSRENILHWPLSGWKHLLEMNSVDSLTLEVYTGEGMWTYLLGDHFEHCDCSSVKS